MTTSGAPMAIKRPPLPASLRSCRAAESAMTSCPPRGRFHQARLTQAPVAVNREVVAADPPRSRVRPSGGACAALALSGMSRPARPCSLVDNDAETTRSSPAISASNPSRATSAGSSLSPGADLGVEHVGALEELGVGRSGHQRRDRHVGVLELVAQRQREGLHERLRRVVDRLEGAGHRRRDRRREQHAPLVAGDHVGAPRAWRDARSSAR